MIATRLSGILGVVLAAAVSTPAKADSYTNPVIRGMNPDPSIVRVGSEYFLTTSSFEYFPSCPVYHSFDLVHWKRIGYALERPEQFAALHDDHPSTYACTLRYHNGRFYALTTDVRGGGNFLVSAENAAGPWSLPVKIDQGMFDPSLLFDDDGKVYYTRRGPDEAHRIVQAEIDVDTGKLSSELRTVSRGMVSTDAEGPHLYHFGEWYYLALAEGGSRFLHMETIGRAKSPWGPFEPDPQNPWVSQHKSWDDRLRTLGHCDLVDTPEHTWWTVCLGTRHFNYAHFSLGRETFLFPVEWHDGWPVVSDHDEQNLTVVHALPSAHPFPPDPELGSFTEPLLGIEWNTLGPAGWRLFSLTERPGYLRLHGQPGPMSFSNATAFVGRRQTEWRTVSSAELETHPAVAGDRAGLTVILSPQYHYDIAVAWENGRRVVQLAKQVADIHVIAAQQPVPDGPVQLRVTSEPMQYLFSWSSDGKEWHELGRGDQRLLGSEVANVWSGAYIAMFSEAGSTTGNPADFRWFRYRAQP